MDSQKTITTRDQQQIKQALRAFFIFLAAIATTELGIMLFIEQLGFAWLANAIFDTVTLIVILLPVSYFLILKPVLAQLQQALHQSEDQFQALTQSATDAILGMDGRGEISIWNNAATKMFGYSAASAIGRQLHELIVPNQYISKALEGMKHFQDSGEGEIIGKPLELTALRKDGTEFPIELAVSAYKFGNEWQATGIIRDITERKQAELKVQTVNEQLRAGLVCTIQVVAKAAEAKDPYTAGHQMRVSRLAREIAQEMGLGSELVEGIRLGAQIHDIGKIQVPSEILSKPGKLSVNEFELIKEHCLNGYDILKGIEFPWPIAEIAYQHHERLDGSGYPQGLKGDAICLEARIVAVADVVEAISSHRPYRPSLGNQVALDEIATKRGKYYDPKVVDACLKIFSEKKFSFDVL
ncbi:MAG: PAS domain S-box protein [Sideroxyarcus sp.]|nr:PAS domain S-box protein [Sideroxyarcus sp.]